MKVSVYTLSGPILDWAVATINKLHHRQDVIKFHTIEWKTHKHLKQYTPSTNWEQGGPIIERECISLKAIATEPVHWQAGFFGQIKGPTALIAAMRCFVASKLGAEVEIPE